MVPGFQLWSDRWADDSSVEIYKGCQFHPGPGLDPPQQRPDAAGVHVPLSAHAGLAAGRCLWGALWRARLPGNRRGSPRALARVSVLGNQRRGWLGAESGSCATSLMSLDVLRYPLPPACAFFPFIFIGFGATPGLLQSLRLGGHSWPCTGDPMRCQGSNLAQSRARQALSPLYGPSLGPLPPLFYFCSSGAAPGGLGPGRRLFRLGSWAKASGAAVA